jgi:histidine triad (HIT) family protein
MRDCVFCHRIERGEYDYEDEWSVAFQPHHPVTRGHFLVIPRKHVTSALESPLHASRAAGLAAELARIMELESFNLITSAGAAATQTVPHQHWHVVPRKEGDGLHLPWTGQAEREGRAWPLVRWWNLRLQTLVTRAASRRGWGLPTARELQTSRRQ